MMFAFLFSSQPSRENKHNPQCSFRMLHFEDFLRCGKDPSFSHLSNFESLKYTQLPALKRASTSRSSTKCESHVNRTVSISNMMPAFTIVTGDSTFLIDRKTTLLRVAIAELHPERRFIPQQIRLLTLPPLTLLAQRQVKVPKQASQDRPHLKPCMTAGSQHANYDPSVLGPPTSAQCNCGVPSRTAAARLCRRYGTALAHPAATARGRRCQGR